MRSRVGRLMRWGMAPRLVARWLLVVLLVIAASGATVGTARAGQDALLPSCRGGNDLALRLGEGGPELQSCAGPDCWLRLPVAEHVHAQCLVGQILFLAVSSRGLRVFDLADQEHPQRLPDTDTTYRVGRMEVTWQTLLLTSPGGLTRAWYSLRSPRSPRLLLQTIAFAALGTAGLIATAYSAFTATTVPLVPCLYCGQPAVGGYWTAAGVSAALTTTFLIPAIALLVWGPTSRVVVRADDAHTMSRSTASP